MRKVNSVEMRKVNSVNQISKTDLRSLKMLVNEFKSSVNELIKKTDSNSNGNYLTVDQACYALKIEKTTLNRWVNNKVVTPVSQNKFKRSDIENLKKKITK